MSRLPHVPGQWTAEIVNPQGGRSWVSAPSRHWLAARLVAELGSDGTIRSGLPPVATGDGRLLRSLAGERAIGAADIATVFGVSKAAAYTRLLRACADGILVRVSRGRYGAPMAHDVAVAG